MAIGERIQYFRKMRGMTQEYLGRAVGLPEGSAHIRIAQYESGVRVPKHDRLKQLAEALGVSHRALTAGRIDSYMDIAHTMFALEDTHDLKAVYIDGIPYLSTSDKYLLDIFTLWAEKRIQLENGHITQDEYNDWRYRFPRGGNLRLDK